MARRTVPAAPSAHARRRTAPKRTEPISKDSTQDNSLPDDGTQTLESAIAASKKLNPGSGEHYRSYVGPPAQYDFMGGTQFTLLFGLGLREDHDVLDVGCGSLRAGRLLLQFLLPGRFVGVEPNSWLWQQAVANEIGEEVLRIKQPRFVQDDTFDLVSIGRSFDFVVMQSVLSHAGGALFNRPLEQAAKVLKPTGQFLFTVLDERSADYPLVKKGEVSAPGWIYPQCVSYAHDEVIQRCAAAGLQAQRLPWYHPRQTWYRAVTEGAGLLSEDELLQLGKGRPLFDDRIA